MKQSAMSPRTGRIIELDIAKGLGILSVILYNTMPASPLHTALGKVPMLNKGLAYLGVHSLYLMAIHNQPNLYGWLNKLSVKLCAGLPGWYMQGMFFLLLTVTALMIAMGLEPRLDPAVRALARRCTGQIKDQTNPERS